MHPQNSAAQYRAVHNQGQVADASPARLVQIMFEHILSHLATAQACMQRIDNDLPLRDVVAKGKAIGKAVRLIGHLDATLNLEQGGAIAANLHNLYLYMLGRLTTANVENDARIVLEVSNLIAKIKSGWDRIVADER
jgi:flagellar protein FliS